MGATLPDNDPRLPENALVYGVENGEGKAYPLAEVRARGGVVNDAVGPLPVVIVARGLSKRPDSRGAWRTAC